MLTIAVMGLFKYDAGNLQHSLFSHLSHTQGTEKRYLFSHGKEQQQQQQSTQKNSQLPPTLSCELKLQSHPDQLLALLSYTLSTHKSVAH